MFYFLKKKKFERQKQNFGNADANTDANTDADVNMLMSAVPYGLQNVELPVKIIFKKDINQTASYFPLFIFPLYTLHEALSNVNVIRPSRSSVF